LQGALEGECKVGVLSFKQVMVSAARLRPKSSEECCIEFTDLLEAVQQLQGLQEPGLGLPHQRWPACVNLDSFIVGENNTILSC
jgi:hypothetical protein